jgi:hypothetical protein
MSIKSAVAANIDDVFLLVSTNRGIALGLAPYIRRKPSRISWWFSLLIIGITIVFFSFAFYELNVIHQFITMGIDTQATIVDKWIENNIEDDTFYYISLFY